MHCRKSSPLYSACFVPWTWSSILVGDLFVSPAPGVQVMRPGLARKTNTQYTSVLSTLIVRFSRKKTLYTLHTPSTKALRSMALRMDAAVHPASSTHHRSALPKRTSPQGVRHSANAAAAFASSAVTDHLVMQSST